MRRRAEIERVAVLVDCESSASWPGRPLDLLMLDIAKWGSAQVRRAYGDLGPPWRRSLLDHAFTPVQEYVLDNSKTSLVIDCMDLLFDRDIDTFAVVSTSPALARLAMRIRETNRKVVGYGDRTAARELVVACHRFVYLDNLEDVPAKCLTGEQLRSNKMLVDMLMKTVRDNADGDSWALLSTVGREIQSILPDFDTRDFGYPKLYDLLLAIDLFDFTAVDSSGRTLQVRPKRDASNNKKARGANRRQQAV